jgi:hypothetical protein
MRSTRHVALAAAIVGAILVGFVPAALGRVAAADPVSGHWNAALVIPSGDVAFALELELRGQAVTGAILNGPERQPFSSGSFDGTTLTLRLDYYDGTLTAKFEDAERTRLVGEYVRQTSKGIGRYEFHATHLPKGAMLTLVRGAAAPALDISGDWVMTIRDKDGKVEEVDEATFAVRGAGSDRGLVTGTVIPVSGDYGLLSGTIAPEPTAGGD